MQILKGVSKGLVIEYTDNNSKYFEELETLPPKFQP